MLGWTRGRSVSKSVRIFPLFPSKLPHLGWPSSFSPTSGRLELLLVLPFLDHPHFSLPSVVLPKMRAAAFTVCTLLSTLVAAAGGMDFRSSWESLQQISGNRFAGTGTNGPGSFRMPPPDPTESPFLNANSTSKYPSLPFLVQAHR